MRTQKVIQFPAHHIGFCLFVWYSCLCASTVLVDSTGTTIVNGNPFFAHGFYIETTSPAEIQAQVKTIGEAGFNLAHIEPLNNPCDAVFAEAQNHNLFLIYAPYKADVCASGTGALHPVFDAIKNKPALFGYGICDDMHDGTLAGCPRNVADVKAMYDDYRMYDPNHISFVALGNGSWDTECFSQKRFDIPGAEIYPVNGGSRINLVYAESEMVVNRAAPWKQSPWIIVQTFNWEETADQRMPTPAEYYNMLYQSIVAGAKGIVYYTFKELTTASPALWNETKKTVPEINRISRFLTRGTITKTNLGSGLFAATWTYRDSVLAIVVNSGNYNTYLNPAQNSASTRTVSLNLPAGTKGPALSPFSGRPSGMTVTGGKLTGSIVLLDVQIYLLSLSTTTAITPGVQISPVYHSQKNLVYEWNAGQCYSLDGKRLTGKELGAKNALPRIIIRQTNRGQLVTYQW